MANQVTTYSKHRQGEQTLTPFFKVKEFACKDGSDTIKIDAGLVYFLTRIREHFNRPVLIHSAYRNAAYNSRVGGAKNSQHVTGCAADFRIKGIDVKEIILEVEKGIMPVDEGGLGVYDYKTSSSFVHIDSRTKMARWYQLKPSAPTGYRALPTGTTLTKGYFKIGTGSDPLPVIKLGDTGIYVIQAQKALLAWNKDCLPRYGADGSFGQEMRAAVVTFQREHGLTPDGIVGPKTWAVL